MAAKSGRTENPFGKVNDRHANTTWDEAELPKLITQRSSKGLEGEGN